MNQKTGIRPVNRAIVKYVHNYVLICSTSIKFTECLIYCMNMGFITCDPSIYTSLSSSGKHDHVHVYKMISPRAETHFRVEQRYTF